MFAANFIILMILGAKHVESPFIELGQLSTAFYFSYFIVLVPLVSLLENLLVDLNLKSINKVSTSTRKGIKGLSNNSPFSSFSSSYSLIHLV
jgi:hypothetical protein